MRATWYLSLWLTIISLFVVVAVAQSINTAKQATDLAMAIQQQRLSLVRSACQDSNNRHDDTVHALNLEIATLPVVARVKARASERYTITLIDALSPKRNCDQVVQAVRLNP